MAELHKSFARHLDPPIDAIVVPGAPSITVARIELGFTLYLDDARVWAYEGAGAVLRSFLAVVPPEYLSWFRTSRMDGYQKFDSVEQAELAQMLPPSWADGRLRHLFEFELTDDIECPSCGFRYREIDPSRANRAGAIEVTLPQEYDPGYLLPIARAALDAGPLWSGIGGYVVRLGQSYRADAFDAAWSWTRRLTGVDIQDPEQMAWSARKGIAGVNWLTIIGSSLARELDFDVSADRSWPWIDPSITSERSAAGNVLLLAGEEPTVGDAHQFDGVSSYREVADATRDVYADPPRFLGRFSERDEGAKWFRRLL